MQFAYKAKDSGGKATEGTVEAPDERAAVGRLRTQKLSVTEIKPAGSGGLFSSGPKPGKMGGSVDNKDVVIFSRQLSTLVSSGVPIVQGLTILSEQAESPNFKLVLNSLRTDIEAGLSIADGMKKHPNAFTELYVAMIRAGEVGGILDTILERLSAYLEANEALKAKVKSALMYPIVVFSAAGLITIFLIVFVIPIFKDIFAGFGAELPFITQMLIDISDFMRSKILYLIPPIGLSVWGFKKWTKTPKGEYQVDKISLQLPIFGILLKKVAIAKFSRTLGTLIKSGVPILQGLETVAKTAGNKVIEAAIDNSQKSIKEGGRISDPLKKANIFPPMVTQMISVGEETGGLDTMLTKIADFYDQEVDTAVKGLTSMLEPLIMIFLGIVIGTIVIAMFMPMFSLGEMVG